MARYCFLLVFLLHLPAIAQYSLTSVTSTNNFSVSWCSATGAAFVAGSNGLALRTGNGGASWEKANLPATTRVTAIDFADNTHGCFATSGGVVFSTNDGGTTFSAVTLDSEKSIASVSLHSGGLGVAVSVHGDVYMTNNYGENWEKTDSLEVSWNYRTFKLRSTVGIAGNGGFVLLYDAGTAGWNRVNIAVDSASLRNLITATGESNVGVALNYGKTIVRGTPDGNFSRVYVLAETAVNAWPYDGDSLIVLTGGSCYYSDGVSLTAPLRPPSLPYYQFAKANTIGRFTNGQWLITGDKSLIATVDNRDTSWNILSYFDDSINRAVYSISFINDSVGYAAGRGLFFLRTENGGLTWRPNDNLHTDSSLPDGEQCNFTSISFFNAMHGIGVGSSPFNSHQIRTLDGGVTVYQGNPFLLPLKELPKVLLISEQSYFFAGRYKFYDSAANSAYDKMTMFFTTDNGKTWSKNYDRADSASFVQLEHAPSGEVLAMMHHDPRLDAAQGKFIERGISMLRLGNDCKITLDSTFCAGITDPNSSFVMVNDSLGFLYGRMIGKTRQEDSSALYRTTTSGKTWAKVPFTAVINGSITAVAFTKDAAIGLCFTETDNNGNFLHISTDKGLTWQTIGAFPTEYVSKITATGKNKFLFLKNDPDGNRKIEIVEVTSSTPVDDPPTPAPLLAPIWLWQPYPNPASAAVNLELQWGAAIAADNTEFALYSMLGETVADLKGLLPHTSRVGDKTTLRWTLPDALPDGMYYLVAGTGGYKRAQALAVIRR